MRDHSVMSTVTPPGTRALEPHWTTRQREVLDLLVCGQTNPQIAERLGISLDGAKWHVSEIITRLGVESREEAADYWRKRTRLRGRVAAGMRALVPGAVALRWAAGGVAVAALAAGAVFAVLALSEDDAPTSATPTAVVTQPPTTAPAAPTSTPSTPAGAATPEVINSVEVRPLRLAEPVQMPAGVLAYYFVHKYAGEGPAGNLWRVYRDAAGTLHHENLFAALYPRTRNPSDIFTTAMDTERGLFAAGVCLEGYCGGYGNPSPDSRAVGFISRDGGVTWQEVGELPRNSLMSGFFGDEVLLNVGFTCEGDCPSVPVPATQLWPSGRPFQGPRPENTYIVQIHGVGVLYRDSNEGTYYDLAGDVRTRPPSVGGIDEPYAIESLTSPLSWYLWHRNIDDRMGRTYVAFRPLTTGGGMSEIVSWDGDEVRPTIELGKGVFLGNVIRPHPDNSYSGDFPPALIDIYAGTVAEIADLVPAEGGQRFIIDAQLGTFLRVAVGPGDCLNVREEPSATSAPVDCAADGVLLRRRGEPPPADPTSWLPVFTPSGAAGWVAAEFVQD